MNTGVIAIKTWVRPLCVTDCQGGAGQHAEKGNAGGATAGDCVNQTGDLPRKNRGKQLGCPVEETGFAVEGENPWITSLKV